MKLSIEEIAAALQEAKIEQPKQSQVLNYLQEVIKEQEQEKQETTLPKTKNEFGVVLYDAEGVLAGKEFTASVYTIKQGDDHGTVLSRISAAVRDQNESAKRKKNVIDTIGGAFQSLKRKFIKEKNVLLKTKEPVRVLISNNKMV